MSWLNSDGALDYPDLDEAYLDRLAGVLGEQKLRELLADGLLELADRLEQLDRLAHANRRRDLASVAHDMIGAAGHMGLTRVSLAATDLERAARRPGPPLTGDVASLAALAERGFAALRARIGPEDGP